MALEATHIRFALDLKEKYQVKDLDKFISGAIYPDSRYITKIDRVLTHPKDYMDWDVLSLDDFKKGWHSHLVCDKIQWQVFKEKRPDIFEGEINKGSLVWVRHTALKVLQDLDDARHFNLLSNLGHLDYTENPNNEDIALLKRYNQIFVYWYGKQAISGMERCEGIGAALGQGHDAVKKIRLQAEEYLKDESIMELLAKVYDEMLARALLI